MADRFDEIAHRVYLDVDARRAAKGTVRVRDLWRPIADALRDETADLRAKLARAEEAIERALGPLKREVAPAPEDLAGWIDVLASHRDGALVIAETQKVERARAEADLAEANAKNERAAEELGAMLAATQSVAYFAPLLEPMLNLVRNREATNHVVHRFVSHHDEEWSLILQRDGGKTPFDIEREKRTQAEADRDAATARAERAEADAAAMREAPTDDEVARIHAYAIDLCSGPTREQAQMIRDIVRRFVELRAESGAGAALLREVEQLRDLAGASGVEVDDIGRIVVVGVAPNERRHTVGREVSDALAEAVLARRHLDPEAATCEPPALLREVEAGRWLAEAADRVRLASSHKLGAALGDLVDALSDFHTARGAR